MARNDLKSSVDDLLSRMRNVSPTEKGTFGEVAVFKICENLYRNQGGILLHSYSYKVIEGLAGNIKKHDNKLYVENTGTHTEVDILYVSKFRVFPIEVKSYRANKITFTNEGISGCSKTDKSPIHQHEMHCRHLYEHIYRGLPNGGTTQLVRTPYGDLATKYIVPIVVMVDKSDIVDMRESWQKEYVKLTILNNIAECINKYNTPLDEQLDLDVIDKLIKNSFPSSGNGYEKYLPPRK